MRFPTFFAVLTIGLSTAGLTAQVTRLDSLDQFGPNRVYLSLGEVPGTGLAELGNSGLGDVFDRWGVRFRSLDQNGLRLSSFTPLSPSHLPLGEFYEIENQPSSGGPDGPLSVLLGGAASRVGLYIQGNSELIELRAFTPDGEFLGVVDRPGIDDFPGSSFLGIETSDPRGIGMVSLRYDETDSVERVSGVAVEYLTQVSVFTVFLPQVGLGSIAGISLDTQVSLANLSNQDSTVTVTFFQSDGSPLTTALAEDGELSLSLGPFESTSFLLSAGSTSLNPAARSGYARIVSSQPVDANAVYMTFDGEGSLLGEAGVGSTIEQFVVNAHVEKSRATGLNTGLAVVNPNDETVELSVIARGAGGALLASRTLGPGQHISVFLDQLFPELQGLDFEGSLILRANGRIAPTLLRTRGGVAAASLPLGGLFLPRIR